MKSVKPGRGTSGMNFLGSVFAIVFGIIWILATISAGAPFFFPLFGLCFIGMAVVQAVYSYKNATGKNRYSAFDIVDEGEEPDPLDHRYGAARPAATWARSIGGFCPYCGQPTKSNFEYCRSCGKRLPD